MPPVPPVGLSLRRLLAVRRHDIFGSCLWSAKAKTKEVAANTKSIESKTKRVGELGVSIAEMKDLML